MFEADPSRRMNRWDVLRLRTGHASEMVLLSERQFAITTHYVRTTFPCAGEGCAMCDLMPGRGLFYVAGAVNGHIMMVEFSGASFSLLEQHAKLMHGGLRAGQVYRLERRATKRPTYSEVVRFKEGCQAVDVFDLCRHVMALYRFPCPNPSEDMAAYERRCRTLALIRNKRAADDFTLSQIRPVTR